MKMTKRAFAQAQDHVGIGPDITRAEVDRAIDDAIAYGFGCLYVNDCDVPYARTRLDGTDILLGSGVGYPRGALMTASKLHAGRINIENGVDCLDFMINVSRLKDGDDAYVADELAQFMREMRAMKPGLVVKVIVECPLLTRAEKVRAAEIVAQSGADYIKVSTGRTPSSSFNVGDVGLIRAVVNDRVRIKASGAIMTIENAMLALAAGADRIGNSLAPMWMEQFDDCLWAL